MHTLFPTLTPILFIACAVFTSSCGTVGHRLQTAAYWNSPVGEMYANCFLKEQKWVCSATGKYAVYPFFVEVLYSHSSKATTKESLVSLRKEVIQKQKQQNKRSSNAAKSGIPIYVPRSASGVYDRSVSDMMWRFKGRSVLSLAIYNNLGELVASDSAEVSQFLNGDEWLSLVGGEIKGIIKDNADVSSVLLPIFANTRGASGMFQTKSEGQFPIGYLYYQTKDSTIVETHSFLK